LELAAVWNQPACLKLEIWPAGIASYR